MYRAPILRRLTSSLIVVGIMALLIASCSAPKELPPPAPTAAATESGRPAWQQKWDSTVAAARYEGKLTIYGDVSPKLREAILAFQSKYDVSMDFVVGMGNDIITKWTNERTAGLSIADVFHLASGPGLLMKPKGGFAPIEPYFILPETRDPKLWVNGEFPWVDADKTMVMLNYAYTSYVTVNTEIIKEGQLKSYRDLLKPEWKGKITFFDPTIPSASLGWVNFILQDVFGLEGGREYLRQFAANAPVISRSASQQMEWIARGRYPIGVGISHANTSDYKARGAPVTVNRFVEGGSINPGSGLVEVPPSPPHPNAAALYINWLLTEEGQAAFARGIAAAPVRTGVVVEGIDPSKVPLPGEKVFLYDEEHSKFNPEAIRITKEAMGDLLK